MRRRLLSCVAWIGVALLPSIALADDGPRRLVVLGDSPSLGAGPHAKLDNWPTQLARMLGPAWQVANHSRGAMSLDPGEQRFAASMPEWKWLVEFEPDVVLISLGASDAIDSAFKGDENIARGATMLVEKLRELPEKPDVYFCLPPPPGADWRRAATYESASTTISDALRRVGAALNVSVIDTRSVLRGQEAHIEGGTVPDAVASQMVARTVFKALTGQEAADDVGPYRLTTPRTDMSRTDYVRAGAIVRAMAGESWASGNGELVRRPSGQKPLLGPIDTGPGDFRMRATVRIGASGNPADQSGPRVGLDDNWIWLSDSGGKVVGRGPLFKLKPTILKTKDALVRDEWIDIEIRRTGVDLEVVVAGEPVIVMSLQDRKRFTLFQLDPNGSNFAIRDWSAEVASPVPAPPKPVGDGATGASAPQP